MLSQITWLEFFGTVGVIVGIYYTYVLVRYYPDKLKRLVPKTKETAVDRSIYVESEDYAAEPEMKVHGQQVIDHGNLEMDAVEALIAELVQVIKSSSEEKLQIDEFKQELQSTLHRGPVVKISAYRSSINELIKSECEKYGTFALNVKEIDVLWE